METLNRVIVLIDMDAFFAQIEQRHNPLLQGKPIFVLGSSSKRSVVTAASYEAKKFGVKSGMPLPKAREFCPNAITVVGNQDKYLDYCYRLIDIYQDFTDLVEPYSIDEAFLDITGSLKLFGTPRQIGHKIKERIKNELDLTCSVGIGPNKLIAKMAAEWQKPDGLTLVDAKDVPQIIWNLPAEELLGVGHRMKIHLNNLGIKTIEDLAKFPVFILKKKFGKWGEALHHFAWGIDNSPVHPAHPNSQHALKTNKVAQQWMGGVNPNTFEEIKSVGHSYTLPKDTTDLDLIRWYIYWLSSKVARRLEKEGLAGRTIHLFVRSFDFDGFGASVSLPEKTNYPQVIANTAYDLFLKNYTCPASIPKQDIDQNKTEPTSFSPAKNRGGVGKSVRLLGVSVSNLSTQDQYQLDLFYDKSKTAKILDSVSQVRDKYGDDIIDLAIIYLKNQKQYIRKKVGCFLTNKEKGRSFAVNVDMRRAL